MYFEIKAAFESPYILLHISFGNSSTNTKEEDLQHITLWKKGVLS